MQTFDSPDLEIREAVARYLDRKIDVDELHDEIADVMYANDAPQVARDVALTLAEYHRGDHTDEEVRDLLAPLLTRFEFQYPHPHQPATRLSSASTRYVEAPLSAAAG